jgi:VWFA-related protein
VKRAPLLAALLVLAAGVAAQQPQFRASVSVVRLDVSVTDDGGPVRGLTADDFTVEDSGSRQTIRVEEAVDAPLDLVLVAPPISSVAYTSADQVSRVTAGLSAFLAQVQDRDRLGVVLAGAPPTRLRALTFGRPGFDAGALTGSTYAAPFDAIAAALREFDDSDRRRALVAFTNAADFRSVIGFEGLVGLTRRLGPAFVLVGTPIEVEQKIGARASWHGSGREIGDRVEATVFGAVFPVHLRSLAEQTGGIVVNLGGGEPAELIEEMFAWLRTHYLISYEPPAGTGWHPVSVQVNRRGVAVTARPGYVVQ